MHEHNLRDFVFPSSLIGFCFGFLPQSKIRLLSLQSRDPELNYPLIFFSQSHWSFTNSKLAKVGEESDLPYYVSPKKYKLYRSVMQSPRKSAACLHGFFRLPCCNFFHYHMTTKMLPLAILRLLPLLKMQLQYDILLYYGQL